MSNKSSGSLIDSFKSPFGKKKQVKRTVSTVSSSSGNSVSKGFQVQPQLFQVSNNEKDDDSEEEQVESPTKVSDDIAPKAEDSAESPAKATRMEQIMGAALAGQVMQGDSKSEENKL